MDRVLVYRVDDANIIEHHAVAAEVKGFSLYKDRLLRHLRRLGGIRGRGKLCLDEIVSFLFPLRKIDHNFVGMNWLSSWTKKSQLAIFRVKPILNDEFVSCASRLYSNGKSN